MLQVLVQKILAQRVLIIRLFQLGYCLLVGLLVWATLGLIRTETFPDLVIQSAVPLGKASLFLFVIVTLPGIARRFKITHPLITLVMGFRRYIGITVALFALVHAAILYIIPTILFSGIPRFPVPTFLVAGGFGLAGLLLLALTSNDVAVRLMGKNWKRLHRLVYVIFWFIFAHVALQGSFGETIVIGGAGLVEMASFVYVWFFQKKAIVPPKSVSPSAPIEAERTV